ncbi:hypothetical protein G4V62_06065 [Bacillaceae bacterium SIJ1]|uniref:BsuPI-related putative proteinase inhibitor n=1 Tax=Litoribacterium kuwaitense TaxID=1398745 RepID=UPI0013EB049A|nr:BsuPI-related putative proteinase inhibitor [Litoribacterium kuwaitense]NGP44542.1 hypothetical protein [Litoribacterium kuwaitense]
MMKKQWWQSIVFIVAILALTACAGETEVTETEEDPASQEETTDSGAQGSEDASDIEQLAIEASPDVWTSGADLRVILTNNTSEDITLESSSGEIVQVIVTNENGDVVYKSSDDEAFTQAQEETTIAAENDVRWTPYWDLTSEGERVPGGTYEMQATLMADTANGEAIGSELIAGPVEIEIPEVDHSVFKDISVEGESGAYTVSGEVAVEQGPFSYAVEDGHNVLLESTPFPELAESEGWSAFSFDVNVEETDLPQNGSLVIVLSNEAGDEKSVRLEQFKQE